MKAANTVELIRRDTDYALRALVYLADRHDEVVSTAAIASAQDVPLDFLRKLFQKCAQRDLVVAHRGPKGGFSLGRAPDEITVEDVVEALQGPITISKCILGKEECAKSDVCPLRKRWLKIGNEISEFMAGITLQDLADELHD